MSEVRCSESPTGVERRTRCTFADVAAESAVQKTFAILGVDVSRPEQVKEFQESLRFGDMLQKAAKKGVFATVTTVVGALMIATWYGIKTLLDR